MNMKNGFASDPTMTVSFASLISTDELVKTMYPVVFLSPFFTYKIIYLLQYSHSKHSYFKCILMQNVQLVKLAECLYLSCLLCKEVVFLFKIAHSDPFIVVQITQGSAYQICVSSCCLTSQSGYYQGSHSCVGGGGGGGGNVQYLLCTYTHHFVKQF